MLESMKSQCVREGKETWTSNHSTRDPGLLPLSPKDTYCETKNQRGHEIRGPFISASPFNESLLQTRNVNTKMQARHLYNTANEQKKFIIYQTFPRRVC